MERLLLLVVVVLLNLVQPKASLKLTAGPECRLPLNLPKITSITTSTKSGRIEFQVDMESDPLVQIESLRWHGSREHKYMLLPIIDGVDGASVQTRRTQAEPDGPIHLTSRLSAPHVERLMFSLLVKLKLPCTTIHMAIHQPAADVLQPINTGRIEKMPPPEIRLTEAAELEYVITTDQMKNSSDAILMGPLSAQELMTYNVPWQGQWVRAESSEFLENGRWREVTTATIQPKSSNGLYEFETNHAYDGGRVGVSFVIPLMVLQGDERAPQVGFLTCVPSQKMSSKKMNGVISFYQPFGQPSCLKFDMYNTKNAIVSMRRKPCRGRSQGDRIDPVFGRKTFFTTNYGEQTYYLPAVEMFEYPDDRTCYELRAVNGFGGRIVKFKIRFYQPTEISVAVDRISADEVKLTCTAKGDGRKRINMYEGSLEDYYNPQGLIEDGETAAREWTKLEDTDLVTGPMQGSASPHSAARGMTIRLTDGHIVSLSNNHRSLFCTVVTKQEFLLEKFDLSTEHLGDTIEI